ncbi:MAG TPA: hypothetical protein VL262_08595 [Vicinamibacterales bacterium]|jgi:hypothetical protein|nr:hypothetical protein [Vicinamibacterales bacterium]
MKPGTLLGVALLTVGLAALTASTSAQGVDPNGDGQACNDAMLRGTYGSQVVGERPAGPDTREQFVALALVTFDGQGNFTQVDNSHGLSGTVANRPGSGTYAVNPDCTATLTLWTQGLPFPIQTKLVVFDRGAETRGLVMSPAVVVATTTSRRIF